MTHVKEEKILAVIPVYNEENTIYNVISDIHSFTLKNKMLIDILTVNDGSSDNTKLVISKFNCYQINFQKNMGKGYALIAGFKYALAKNYDYVIQIDGDGQHSINDTIFMLNTLKKKKLDVIIGSRFINNRSYSTTFFRKIGILYFNLLFRLVTSHNITDCTSGFRIINRKALKIISNSKHYKYAEIDMIIQYIRNNIKFDEVAIQMLHRQGGKSSFNFFSALNFISYNTYQLVRCYIIH